MSAVGDRLPAAGNILSRIVREPLLQFAAIGIFLFAANEILNEPNRRGPADEIVISKNKIEQLAGTFKLLSGRPPNELEMKILMDDFVLEEISYREALMLGLDTDDVVVRRRMRQKLEFLYEDMDAIEDPTSAELQAWLDSHAVLYVFPERRALRQVLASSDGHGEAARAVALGLQAQLRAGAEPSGLGDSSLLPAAMPLTTASGVSSLFGDRFATEVFAHAGADWFGPVPSTFGQHLVQVIETEPARKPDVEEIRERLKTDWIDARRAEQRAKHVAELRRRYKVRLD